MQDKQEECVHKLGGQSSLIVYEQHGNKYLCKCSSCSRTLKLKFKQVPNDADWQIRRE